MKIGFAKEEITPPPGTELGGYAGYRPCAGCHDPLWCKAVVVEQKCARYALLVMDLLSIDESLAEAISQELMALGIDLTLVAAIHTHAAPCGILLGVGPLAEVNRVADSDPAGFTAYTHTLIRQAIAACAKAVENMENFLVGSVQTFAPIIGSERHTGEAVSLAMTAVQMKTESGRKLLLYQIPCHPTVLGPENLLASADFVGSIEKNLDADMAVFLNGAAGDISTRFTRQSQTFEECERMGKIAAESIGRAIKDLSYCQPEPIKGLHTHILLQPKAIETAENAQKTLDEATAQWKQALNKDADPGQLRLIKSKVEGAQVALEFVRTMAGIKQCRLPVTVFTFAGLQFVTVPGEMYSSLWTLKAVPICYANGYYRYITDQQAYDAGHYEAMAAILAQGQGEIFMKQVASLLREI
jgi:hypothetical protein